MGLKDIVVAIAGSAMVFALSSLSSSTSLAERNLPRAGGKRWSLK